MLIGERIRKLRERKDLSQEELEQRSGLLRCYISRVEHGHTVPSLESLERFAAALDIPLYRLFYEDHDERMDVWPTREDRGVDSPGFFHKLRVNAQFPSPWDAVLFHALALLSLIWIVAHIVRFVRF
jgi:transcriptional regulator with XRE-family HTH domain